MKLHLALALVLLTSAGTTRAEFDFEEYKARLPWIWKRPGAPAVPVVQDSSWATDDIDRFVLARLEEANMRPAARAEDRTWLRRIHFAITGLPPSRDEVQAFCGDRAPDRRRNAVRRLLASPHYGERWARHWMDLVRYAESRGHESDFEIPNAWRYRDYLVRAFNADVPYDQFVTEHLAGDLLEKPRLRPETGANESILATAWPFLGEEVHSPVDIRQDECDRADNKIDVLSKAFLGLTVACARCHDHKFDAIYQSDYYALAGFVASSSYRQARYESIEQNKAAARQLEKLRAEMRPRIATAFTEAAFSHFQNLPKQDRYEIPGPLAIEPSDTIRVLADFTRPGASPWIVDGPSFGAGVSTAGELILGQSADEPAIRIAPYGAARRDPFWNGLRVVDSANDPGSFNSHARAGKMVRTPAFELKSGKLHYLIRGHAFVYAGVSQHIMVTGPLHGRLVQQPDVPGDAPRWVSHDLTPYAGLRAHVEFGPVGDSPLEILMVVEADQPPELVHETLSVTRRELSEAWNDLGDGDLEASHIPAARWIVAQAAIKAGQISHPYLDGLAAIREEVRWDSRLAVAWLDGNGVNESNLERGSPQMPLAPAVRRLPEAFGYDAIDARNSGRLVLARQIARPDNPLTARVMANRIWHHLLGRGLVRTVDNFGWLGERPSHPELLDYLAREFVDTHQWSIKSFLERLLLTQTFAMASESAAPAFDHHDPDNILLHRMPVRRIEAESIRDAVLAVSGRLDRAVGGPPVPAYLDEFVAGRGRPAPGPLDGAGRRSIYTAARRNFLPTLMLAFDFPAPFTTQGQRDVTNVPAQSLALMNDPFIYEQSRLWAERILGEMPNADAPSRLKRMFEEAFARPPADHELAIVLETLPELMQIHGGDPNARDLWHDLCHGLFAMNDLIYLR